MKRMIPAIAMAVAAAVFTSDVKAQPTDILVGFNANQNNGRTRRTVTFWDAANANRPMFSVFLGWDEALNYEDPDAITVDSATGTVYVQAFDSGDAAITTPSGYFTGTMPTVGEDVTGRTDRINDNDGDLDLYTIDFKTIYEDWAAGNGDFATYYGVYNQTQAALFQNPFAPSVVTGLTDAYDASHDNPTFIANAIDKVGELARSDGGGFFARRLEFIDSDTLVYLDAQAADQSSLETDDVQIRIAKRVSTSNGAATTSGSFASNQQEGGFNQGTSESWESSIVGNVVSDFAGGLPSTASEVEAISGLTSVANLGVQGFFFGESDAGAVFAEVSDPNGDSFTSVDNDGDEIFGPRADDLGFYKLVDTNNDGTPDSAARLSIDQNIYDENGVEVFPSSIRLYDDPTGDVGASTVDGKWTTTSQNPALRPADFNNDGKIDAVDVSIMASNFGGAGLDAWRGDTDGDGNVDATDLTEVQNTFGLTSLRGADGSFDHVFVDDVENRLVIIESDVFDSNADGTDNSGHPSVITVQYSYDSVNDRIVIDNGTWTIAQILSDPNSPYNFEGDNTADGISDGFVFTNDSGGTDGVEFPLEGRQAVFDPDANAVYFIEDDEVTPFGLDIYKLDIASGLITQAFIDSELSFSMFDSDDVTEFLDASGLSLSALPAGFFGNAPNQVVIPEPATIALLGLGGLAVLRRRSRA